MKQTSPGSLAAEPSVNVPRDEQVLRKEAVAWYARLCSGDATEVDHQALQGWLQQHPDHRRAWERIESMRRAMQRVPAGIAMPTLQASSSGRRNVLRGIVLLASAGSIGYVSYRAASDHALIQPWLADYRTRVGERRSVMLADGSRMVLNTDSAADVAFTQASRMVTLWAGEVLIETARQRGMSEDSRPFIVRTEQGTVLALGTRFVVRSHGDRTEVSVLEHAVELRTLDGHAVRVLQAGESAFFTRSDIAQTQATNDTVAQWEHGSLVVGDARLGDVIAELARYRRGRLACDPAVADIRVSGAYPIDDTDKALKVLVQSFPLRITSTTRYWVVVGPV